MSFEEVQKAVVQFRDARNWRQFHNPKDPAISISLEAAELMELFQWKAENDFSSVVQERKKDIQEELADVMIYCFSLADVLGIDVRNAISEKMVKNGRKYPAPPP